ncbi:MAG: hypothetical protein JWQ51_2765 [Tardiphaga sp.]|nr:hypothetical protein [Tardiphaga sp.]
MKPSQHFRRIAIFSSEVRHLGGYVSVTERRDRIDGEPFYSVGHVSRGGDVVFQSGKLHDEDQAAAAARVLAEFTGAEVRH